MSSNSGNSGLSPQHLQIQAALGEDNVLMEPQVHTQGLRYNELDSLNIGLSRLFCDWSAIE